jgi:conjugative transposon TraM protein
MKTITINQLKSINWRQPKYAIPAIIYLPLLFTGYFVIDLCHTEPANLIDDGMVTKESLNYDLPEAQLNSDGIGGKYENMAKSFGGIQDFSAVENIERDGDEEDTENYDTKYTDEEIALLDQEAALKEQLLQSAEKGKKMEVADKSKSEASSDDSYDQSSAIAELNKALAEARLKGQQVVENVKTAVSETTTAKTENKTIEETPQVVKKVRTNSDYFNTLAENEPEQKLIKAIIDENITAYDGSRVRLRLLDDVEINDGVLPKGSYIYATMSGFGSQRVKGNIQSLMIDDELVKVNLSLYDTDGLEGLYVPSSSFRETSKDIASSALSSNVSMNSGSYNSSFSQWGMQAIQNAYQQTANAISKAVKKNKAKLKYGTFVYLVNTKDTKNK